MGLKDKIHKVEIEISSPILRNGLVMKTTSSGKYASERAKGLIEIAREFNKQSHIKGTELEK